MLTALEQGVKGGKWFSLIDKVHPERTLHAAFRQVAANKGAAGVDHVTVDDVRGPPGSEPEAPQRGTAERDLPPAGRSAGTTSPNRGARRSGRWEFRRFATGWFKRRCGSCWSRSSSATSPSTVTAFAPDGAAKTRCAEWTSCSRRVTRHIVDADLKSYFDTIPHDRLMALVGQKVSDGRVLSLIESFLKQGVLDGLREWTPEEGHAARGGDQPAAEQHLSEPAGPSDGRAGIRDGALRRRLRDPVSQPGGSGPSLGRGASNGRRKPA